MKIIIFLHVFGSDALFVLWASGLSVIRMLNA